MKLTVKSKLKGPEEQGYAGRAGYEKLSRAKREDVGLLIVAAGHTLRVCDIRVLLARLWAHKVPPTDEEC